MSDISASKMSRSLDEIFGPPPKHKTTPVPEPKPRTIRQFLLSGDSGDTTVTMTRKYGVWFITAAHGALRLFDLIQWGDCLPDLERAARHLHLAISEPAAPRLMNPVLSAHSLP